MEVIMIKSDDYDITELDSDQKSKVGAVTAACACSPITSLVDSAVDQLCEDEATV
jgi:hypothetical protein